MAQSSELKKNIYMAIDKELMSKNSQKQNSTVTQVRQMVRPLCITQNAYSHIRD